MFRNTSKNLIAIVFSSYFSLANAGELAELYNAPQSSAIANQYIVVYKKPDSFTLSDATTSANFTSIVTNELKNTLGIEVIEQYSNAFNGMLVTADAAALASLRAHPDIDFVEQDQIISIDPIFSAQQANPTWGLDRIDQRALPLDQLFNPQQQGAGVTAYVIDTGVKNNHNDFGGRASSGWDFIDNDGNSDDCNGHGTHVAGTIAGAIHGVAKQADIVGVRVLGCTGSGSTSGVIDGINWVAGDANGPSVANMSLGGSFSAAMNAAVAGAVSRGVFFAVAAGNDNGNACSKSPAGEPSAYTVGSTTINDSRSSFSNYGNCLDIYAPGSNITSAWIGSRNATRTISGTSMAAPHVAGSAVLLLDENPNLTPAQLSSALSHTATPNTVGDAKAGSPNLLVYVGDDNAPGLDKTVSGDKNVTRKFTYDVPAGTSKLTVKMAGGSGDADLYIKYGVEAWALDSDCYSENPDTSNEVCIVNNPRAGTWHISVYGYTAFSNVRLTASHD